MTILRAGTATDVGRVRSNNQDSHLVLGATSLYGVADGMGGHQGGEVASAIAVELTGKHATEPTLDSLMAARATRLKLCGSGDAETGTEKSKADSA